MAGFCTLLSAAREKGGGSKIETKGTELGSLGATQCPCPGCKLAQNSSLSPCGSASSTAVGAQYRPGRPRVAVALVRDGVQWEKGPLAGGWPGLGFLCEGGMPRLRGLQVRGLVHWSAPLPEPTSPSASSHPSAFCGGRHWGQQEPSPSLQQLTVTVFQNPIPRESLVKYRNVQRAPVTREPAPARSCVYIRNILPHLLRVFASCASCQTVNGLAFTLCFFCICDHHTFPLQLGMWALP